MPSGGLPDAAAYLTLRTFRNRGRRVLKRIRSPRYAIALLLGLAYLGLILFGQHRGTQGGLSRPAVETGGILLFTLLAAKWWLLGADRLALAFSPAEIQFLFPAPVDRNGLLGYKLLRAQIPILVNTAIWLLLLRGGSSTLPTVLHGLSLWLIFSTLFLHRMGVALSRDTVSGHGAVGWSRHGWVLLVLLGLIVLGTVSARQMPTPDEEGPLAAVRLLLDTPPLAWALLPFRIPFRPLAATDFSQWLLWFSAAVALAVGHVVWILRADRAFEDTAIEASRRRAEVLERWKRSGGATPTGVTKARRWISLSATGHPAGAIAWKNITRLIRSTSPALLVVFALLACGLAGFALFGDVGNDEIITLIGTLALSWLGVLVIFGPQWVRNDLRGELDHLALLKTWPISGAALMTGQIVASAAVLTGLQVLLGLVGLAALVRLQPGGIPPALLIAAVGPGLLVLAGLNGAALAIQNAGALLYPAWVRTELRPGGIEAMGQHLLTAGVSLLLLAAVSVGPVLIGALVGYAWWTPLGSWSLSPALLATALVLGLEAYLIVSWLGGRFQRLDPSDPE